MSASIEVNRGWEERYKDIQNKLEVHLMPGVILTSIHGLISEDERTRSLWKIRLVEPFVHRMVLNMIKGTIKYPTDDWPAEVWEDMGMDDQADSVNYSILLRDHLRERGVL